MIDVKFNDVGVREMMDHLKRYTPVFARAVTRDAVAMHQNVMARRIGRGVGSSVKSKTGHLADSLRMTKPERKGGEFVATSNIGRGVTYAKIHEEGGTIRPKNRRYLTIPLRNAKTAKGVQRSAARLVRSGGSFQTRSKVPGAASRDTFIYERRNRKFIAVEGGGGRPINLYMLAKQVEIKPRLSFRKSWQLLEPRRATMYRRKLRRLVKRGQVS